MPCGLRSAIKHAPFNDRTPDEHELVCDRGSLRNDDRERPVRDFGASDRFSSTAEVVTLQYRTASHRRIRGSEGSHQVGISRSGRSSGSTTTFDDGSSIHPEPVDDLGSMTGLVRADGFHPVASPALPPGTSIRRSSGPSAVIHRLHQNHPPSPPALEIRLRRTGGEIDPATDPRGRAAPRGRASAAHAGDSGRAAARPPPRPLPRPRPRPFHLESAMSFRSLENPTFMPFSGRIRRPEVDASGCDRSCSKWSIARRLRVVPRVLPGPLGPGGSRNVAPDPNPTR